MDIIDVLKKNSITVDREIYRSLSAVYPRKLQDASKYLVNGGKKIRPSLVLLSCAAVGGNVDNALKTAAAVEMIHTFSLIHDDIMDKDEMRRGKSSVHVKWGEPMAILTGDTLFSKAFETILETRIDGVTYERVTDALKTVVDSCTKICEGQAFDMCFEGNFEVTESEYLNMIYMKTAALIAAAAKAGAIIGGGTPEQVEAFEEYGRLIGMAFQIQDDYLDVVGNEEDLGKPVGSDIVKGKMTLMVVNALSKASSEDKNELISILKAGEDTDVGRAIEILEKYDSIRYTYNISLNNVKKAKKLLDMVVEDSDAKNSLLMLADYVLRRTS